MISFYQLYPKNRQKIKQFQKSLIDLRRLAKEQILKRADEIKTDPNVRKDILSFILKNEGLYIFRTKFPFSKFNFEKNEI